jgi:two-component system response regulator AtoC
MADEDDTLRPSQGPAQGLCLLVSADGIFATWPLPEEGEVTIGRKSGSDVRIDHASISRQHARLRIGDSLVIEDLGSVNGTRVREQPLEAGRSAHIEVGEVVELGSVMVMVRRASAQVRPRRLWPHGYFEGRVEEECARAARSGEPFAMLRISVDSPSAPGIIDDLFTTTLRTIDVLAIYAPREYEVLLVSTSPEDAEAVAQRIRAYLQERRVSVRIGLACHPRDASTPEALVARACDAVRPPQARDEPVVPESSTAMRQLHRLTEQIAASNISVLILGETGSGKEVLAEALHRRSPRAQKRLLRLHCAAFSESLLESELFGHERGSFTGAHAQKPGLLETAHGGTVLLDEVGELPPSTQVKLLRVLEERKVLRVGGLEPRAIDVRFLAATNRDLEAEVVAGRFRQDLYFRLNGVSLLIPPLRERLGELEGLARNFILQASRQPPVRERPPALSPEALQRLRQYSWPGNIRELRNLIERAVLLCGDGPILVEHLPVEKMSATLSARSTRPRAIAQSAAPPVNDFDADVLTAPMQLIDPPGGPEPLARNPLPSGLHSEVSALERQRILDALERCAGNQTQAARQLGISRGTLISRLDSYGIARPRKPG